MSRTRAALLLLVVQVALVLSIAGKFLYERKTRPRVWTRAAQYDPSLPLRGRYLALQLAVDACGLPRDQEHFTQGYYAGAGAVTPGSWNWKVSLDARDGRLVPRLEDRAKSPEGIQNVTLREDRPCDRAPLQPAEDLFISDRAKGPFPLAKGDELWVEVTVPALGPPRPIQLALSNASGFHPLHLD